MKKYKITELKFIFDGVGKYVAYSAFYNYIVAKNEDGTYLLSASYFVGETGLVLGKFGDLGSAINFAKSHRFYLLMSGLEEVK